MDAEASYETAEHLLAASPEKAIEMLEVIGMQIISWPSILFKYVAAIELRSNICGTQSHLVYVKQCPVAKLG